MEMTHSDYSIIYNIGIPEIKIQKPDSRQIAKYIIAFRVFAIFWFLLFLIKLVIACVQVLTDIAK